MARSWYATRNSGDERAKGGGQLLMLNHIDSFDNERHRILSKTEQRADSEGRELLHTIADHPLANIQPDVIHALRGEPLVSL
jgi:hypothetical protein